jgi:hypothetical protein
MACESRGGRACGAFRNGGSVAEDDAECRHGSPGCRAPRSPFRCHNDRSRCRGLDVQRPRPLQAGQHQPCRDRTGPCRALGEQRRRSDLDLLPAPRRAVPWRFRRTDRRGCRLQPAQGGSAFDLLLLCRLQGVRVGRCGRPLHGADTPARERAEPARPRDELRGRLHRLEARGRAEGGRVRARAGRLRPLRLRLSDAEPVARTRRTRGLLPRRAADQADLLPLPPLRRLA